MLSRIEYCYEGARKASASHRAHKKGQMGGQKGPTKEEIKRKKHHKRIPNKQQNNQKWYQIN
jgi:hypothetical protein